MKRLAVLLGLAVLTSACATRQPLTPMGETASQPRPPLEVRPQPRVLAAPSNLTVTPKATCPPPIADQGKVVPATSGSYTATLTFTDCADNETDFRVERAVQGTTAACQTDPASPTCLQSIVVACQAAAADTWVYLRMLTANTVPAPSPVTFTDSLPNAATYCFRVRAAGVDPTGVIIFSPYTNLAGVFVPPMTAATLPAPTVTGVGP